MDKQNIIGILAASLVLTACSGAGNGLSNAITDPLNPKTNGNYKEVVIQSGDSNSLLLDANSTIKITDEEKTGADRTKTYQAGGKLDIGHKKQDKVTELTYERTGGQGYVDGGSLLIYKQNHSVIVGTQPSYARYPNGQDNPDRARNLSINTIQGNHTPANKIPTGGFAQYSGKAFAGKDDVNGTLNYRINFGSKTGSGTITGLPGVGNISLKEGSLRARPDHSTGIDGNASSDRLGEGRYGLTLFGPNADEVAGSAYFNRNNQSVGFGGKKQ